jgi:protein-tyrosine phosphatase
MTAAFLSRGLERVGVAAQVVSVGMRVHDPQPALPEVIDAMRGYGIELSEHRSRPLTAGLARGAHLVLGLAREHLREAVLFDERLLEFGFTVKELARRAGTQGYRPAGVKLQPWLAGLVADREIEELLGASPLDDIDDPVGGPLAAYQDTAAELSSLVDRIVRTVWAAGPTR